MFHSTPAGMGPIGWRQVHGWNVAKNQWVIHMLCLALSQRLIRHRAKHVPGASLSRTGRKLWLSWRYTGRLKKKGQKLLNCLFVILAGPKTCQNLQLTVSAIFAMMAMMKTLERYCRFTAISCVCDSRQNSLSKTLRRRCGQIAFCRDADRIKRRSLQLARCHR